MGIGRWNDSGKKRVPRTGIVKDMNGAGLLAWGGGRLGVSKGGNGYGTSRTVMKRLGEGVCSTILLFSALDKQEEEERRERTNFTHLKLLFSRSPDVPKTKVSPIILPLNHYSGDNFSLLLKPLFT